MRKITINIKKEDYDFFINKIEEIKKKYILKTANTETMLLLKQEFNELHSEIANKCRDFASNIKKIDISFDDGNGDANVYFRAVNDCDISWNIGGENA